MVLTKRGGPTEITACICDNPDTPLHEVAINT